MTLMDSMELLEGGPILPLVPPRLSSLGKKRVLKRIFKYVLNET